MLIAFPVELMQSRPLTETSDGKLIQLIKKIYWGLPSIRFKCKWYNNAIISN